MGTSNEFSMTMTGKGRYSHDRTRQHNPLSTDNEENRRFIEELSAGISAPVNVSSTLTFNDRCYFRFTLMSSGLVR